MAFIDSSELGHCPTAQLLIENEVPSRIAAKDGSVFDFSAEIADYAATRLGWTTLASRPPSDPAEIAIIAQQARGEGLDAVVLIGQGGSTQAPQTVTKLYSLEVTDEVRSRRWTRSHRSTSTTFSVVRSGSHALHRLEQVGLHA